MRVSMVSPWAAGQRIFRLARRRGREIRCRSSRWYKAAVEETLEFADLLRLMDERSTAFPAGGRRGTQPRRCGCRHLPRVDVVRPGAAPGRRAPQVGRHRGRRARRRSSGRSPPREWARPGARGPAGWFAASTWELLDALRGGRPGSWLLDVVGSVTVAADHWCRRPATSSSRSPCHLRRPGRRGRPRRCLPDEVALDGVDEFLTTCVATTAAVRTSPRSSTTTPPRAAPGDSGSPPTAARAVHLHAGRRRGPGGGRRLRPGPGQ